MQINNNNVIIHMSTVGSNNTTTYKMIKYANMHYIKYVKKNICKVLLTTPAMRLQRPPPVPNSLYQGYEPYYKRLCVNSTCIKNCMLHTQSKTQLRNTLF